MQTDEILKRFTYHSPSVTQVPRYNQIRQSTRRLALIVNQLCPDSREKSVAMTKLEEFVMWANASIARNESASYLEDSPSVGDEQPYDPAPVAGGGA